MSTIRELPPVPGIPPGPPPSALPGIVRDLATDRLTLMSSAAHNYGDAVRIRVGPKTLYFLDHPDHAKHVLAENPDNYHKGIGLVQARRALGDGLLTSDGDLWRGQRALVSPTFGHKRVAEASDVIADEAARLVSGLWQHRGHSAVDVVPRLTELTLGVLGRALLDVDRDLIGSVGPEFETVQDQAMFEMVSMNSVPNWLPLPRNVRFRRARARLRRIVDDIVARRSLTPLDRDDLLARLIGSTNAEPDPAVGTRRMRDEVITLLLAGHETTASTLSWTLYLLDRHPWAAQRVHDEVVAVLGRRPPSYEDLHRLRYTTMVLQESMRLYPPVWILPRVAVGEDVIGGYRIPAGSDVLVSPYTLHRHPAFWDEPDLFRPERFDPDLARARARYAYIPFGAGPRFCVGNNLGMVEATFALALICRDLRLSVEPGHPVVPEPMLSLRIRGGLPVRVESW